MGRAKLNGQYCSVLRRVKISLSDECGVSCVDRGRI